VFGLTIRKQAERACDHMVAEQREFALRGHWHGPVSFRVLAGMRSSVSISLPS